MWLVRATQRAAKDQANNNNTVPAEHPATIQVPLRRLQQICGCVS